jgi:hypothetical protein
MDDGVNGDFVTIVGNTTNTLQTAITIREGIVKGRVYRFRYRCKNSNGWSSWSDITAIEAAVKPSAPGAPILVTAS